MRTSTVYCHMNSFIPIFTQPLDSHMRNMKRPKDCAVHAQSQGKSNESLFKLRQDTEKAKIFADQIEEQAKRKLKLIKIKTGVRRSIIWLKVHLLKKGLY